MLRIYLLLACIATALISCPSAALADGKVFLALAENASTATMPDQQALIHFKDGVETLAIETRFVGAAENFAWVVPLPAVPEITPATPGLFKTLRAMHQPKIVGTYRDLATIWIPAIVVLLIVIARPHWFVRVVTLTVVVFVVVVSMLPTLGKARSVGGDGAGEVAEVSRQLVGDFEVVVVESREPDALVAWLKEHGFGVPPAAEKVIDSYVADGWVFAAAKMRGDLPANPDAPRTPHPLVFKFPVQSPVYPVRLTGVENAGPLRVELYVLADQGAAASGFTVARCGEATYGETVFQSHRHHRGPNVYISHSWLREHAPDAAVATKLVGTLSPEQMTRDVQIGLAPMRVLWPRRWTVDAAVGRAIDVGLGGLTFGLAGVVMLGRVRQRKPRSQLRPLLVVCALAVMASAAAYGVTDVARDIRKSRLVSAHDFGDELLSAAMWRRVAGDAVDEEWLRATAHQIASRLEEDEATAPIEEDSPGNYQLRRVDGEWWFVWYDYFGNEHVYPNPLAAAPAIDPAPL